MPIFEIIKELELFDSFETYDAHVAYVDNEQQAIAFCEKHKECKYQPIFITKYDIYLEGNLNEVPCCENCLYRENKDCTMFDCDIEKHYLCECYDRGDD